MKIIAWDIDDVLMPWYATAHDVSIKFGLTHIGSDMPVTWYPYEEYGVEAQAWYDALALATATGYLYGQPPVEGAQSAIQGFHELGYIQHFITARGFMQHGDAIREQTLLWVEQHFGGWYEELVFTREKGIAAVELGVTHAIDDNVGNYEAMDDAGVEVYLHTQTWNLHAPDHYRRVNSVDDFVAEVTRS